MSTNRREIATDYLAALTDTEMAEFLTEARPDLFVRLYVVAHPGGLHHHHDAGGVRLVEHAPRGTVLPDGFPVDQLAHALRAGIVRHIDIPAERITP